MTTTLKPRAAGARAATPPSAQEPPVLLQKGKGIELKGTRGGKPATHEEVARRAFELYEARGWNHGHDQDDWLQAERELKGGSGRR